MTRHVHAEGFRKTSGEDMCEKMPDFIQISRKLGSVLYFLAGGFSATDRYVRKSETGYYHMTHRLSDRCNE